MSGNGQEPGSERGEISPEDRAAMRQRASELGKRLDEAKARKAGPQTADGRARGAAMGEAFKIVSELIVGVAVGGGIGWFLDRQLGSAPWLLILFLVLGFAAGMSNVIRTARKMQAEAEPLQRAAKPLRDDEDDDGADEKRR